MTDNELQRKLGLEAHLHSYILHAPLDYGEPFPTTAQLSSSHELMDDSDWIQAFYSYKVELEREIPQLKHRMAKDGQLWICWPKKSSHLASDLSDDLVRQAGLDVGLVDVKVASINETWSGLKFVYRKSDR